MLPSGFLRDVEAIRLAQGKILAELNRSKPAMPLSDCEFRVFSQWGEDGIIQKLISVVPVANRTFIEFGVEDFAEANCRFLLMNNNWSGFVLDANATWVTKLLSADWLPRYELEARCTFLTRENINEVLLGSGFARDLGILSVDVDGIDYWLLEAIESYTPRILIVEYNAVFGGERCIAVPYDPILSRRAKHYSELYFGASLGALAYLAKSKGCSLVGVDSAGVNAFFVRTDLLGDQLKEMAVRDVFVETKVRQSRNEEGKLNYLGPDARRHEISGMPVVNVETGAMETY
ncbi:hypothetical protein BH09GEM1_BH09GEM1_23550 [soil metagenome]